MYDDRPDDDSIPPLDRPGVAPVWRVLAVAALFGIALLGSMVAVLFMALVDRGKPLPNNWGMPAPAIAVGAAGGAAADPAEDVLDPLNPAYPMRQDLRPAGTFPLVGDPEADPQDRPRSPRQEFRKLAGEPVWQTDGPDLPDRVLISPDGRNMAYIGVEGLMLGPLGAPLPVDQNPFGNAMPPGMRRFGGVGMAFPGQPARPHAAADTQASVCGWSSTGGVVAWVRENGRPCLDEILKGAVTRLEFKAVALLPVAALGDRQVVVSREPRAKLDGGAYHDLTTVKVLSPDAKQPPTILAGPEASHWESPALSPDDSRLAIVSDRQDGPGRRRLFLLSLDNKEKIEPVSPPAKRYEGVCWTPDGKALVYARSESPAPADHAPGMAKDACDLYLLDLATKTETRLSRGGGFTSPSVTKDGHLYFVTRIHGANAAVAVHLLRVQLQDAVKWAEGQDKDQADKGKEWKELADAVFKQAGVRADAGQGATLEGGAQKKLAEAFARVYKEKLAADPPATADALDRQRREVAGLDLSPEEQERFRLLLGAVEGEYLLGRQKGTEWHTTKERGGASAPVSAENAFGYAFNPFRPLRPSEKDESPQSLAEVLYRAEGRTIVLSNDDTMAKDVLDKLVDPERAQGSALLAKGNADAADRVLLGMVKRHEGNQYLVVEVGTLLYRHGRTKALAELVKPLLADLDHGGLTLARDPRLYNLLGVGALEGDANKAVMAFNDALRCDLNYGPAYVNLAQAYQKANRPADARLCLRRYLKLFPEGELADDARRRLAAAGDD
jgi:tetratricopeptide (TPR) repeat protein